MVDDIIQKLKNSLKAFEKSITETDENYDALETLGRYNIRDPYSSKYFVSSALDRYEKKVLTFLK